MTFIVDVSYNGRSFEIRLLVQIATLCPELS